jgi:hypothetical protein
MGLGMDVDFATNRINKSTYNSMKFAAFVALWLTTAVLGLSSTELTKVLSCLGHNILEQFHLNPPQLLPCRLMSVYLDRHAGTCFRERQQRHQQQGQD